MKAIAILAGALSLCACSLTPQQREMTAKVGTALLVDAIKSLNEAGTTHVAVPVKIQTTAKTLCGFWDDPQYSKDVDGLITQALTNINANTENPVTAEEIRSHVDTACAAIQALPTAPDAAPAPAPKPAA